MAENGLSQQSVEEKLHGMDQGSSRATEDQQTYEQNVVRMDKLLSEGHKLMLAHSFDDASAVLSEAVELASKFFGDFAPQSFLPHFNYGKTLIEIARLESLLVKPPLQDIDDSDEEDEEEGSEEDKEEQNGKGSTLDNDHQKIEETDEKKEADCETKEMETKGRQEEMEEEKEKDAEQPPTSDAILEGDEDGDEDDSQIAWENLEVARKICENQMRGDQMKLWMERKADVLVSLGDCMTVSENFPCALEEFTKALDIRKELFGNADRRVAEVHFWIGRTHKLMDDFKTAAEHFENAKKVLNAVIEVKQKELTEKGEELTACPELKELEDMVKGVEENVQDAVDSMEQQMKREEIMKAMLQPILMHALSANGNILEANDITGMVKRKAVKRQAVANDGEITDQKDAKMSKMETENGNGGQRQTIDDEENGN